MENTDRIISEKGANALFVTPIKEEPSLNHCESTLVFILTSLSLGLDLPNLKQAAAFLTSENKYLIHACHKGLKGGDYDPIKKWLLMVEEHQESMMDLVEQDLESFPNVVKVMSCTMASLDQEVVAKGVQILNKVLDVGAKLGGKIGEEAKPILSKCLVAVEQHPKLNRAIGKLVKVCYRDEYFKLIEDLKLCEDRTNFPDLLPFVGLEDDAEAQKQLLIEVTENFELDKIYYLRMIIISWALNPQIVEEKVDQGVLTIQDIALKVIVKVCRDENKSIRISSQAMIFELLDQFAQAKNPQSPSLYKLLTFSFIENFGDEVTREFMSFSFMSLFAKIKSIPISILLEPLIRKLKHVHLGATDRTCGSSPSEIDQSEQIIMHFDIKLLKTIIQHNKLKLFAETGGSALDLADFLAQHFIVNTNQTIVVMDLLIELIQRYKQEVKMQDFCKKFYTICFKEFMHISTDQNKKRPIANNDSFFDVFWEPESATRRIHWTCILNIIEEILKISIQNSKQDLIEILYKQKTKFSKTFATESKALSLILKRNVAEHQMTTIMQQDDNLSIDRHNSINDRTEDELSFTVDKTNLSQRGVPKNLLSIEADLSVIDHQQIIPGGSPQSLKRQIQDSRKSADLRPIQDSRRSADLPPAPRKRSKIDQKALDQIEQIRIKKEEQIKQKQLEEEKLKEKEIRTKRNLSKQLRSRREQLGLVTPNAKQVELLAVKDEAPATTKNKRYRSIGPSFEANEVIQLVDLKLEEQRDLDALQILSSKCTKAFKYMFSRYAGTRTQTQKIQGFDHYSEKTINLQEIQKMYKEWLFNITKQNLQNLYKVFGQNELNFNQFVQFLQQTAFYIYKNEQIYESFNNLIKHLKTQNAQIFLKEQLNLSDHQKQKIQEIEQHLKLNPSYLIPEGYTVSKELKQFTDYKVPASFNLSTRFSLEIIDDILNTSLGFHFLEPILLTKWDFKVKPKLALGKIEEKPPLIQEVHSRRSRSVRKLSPIKQSVEIRISAKDPLTLPPRAPVQNQVTAARKAKEDKDKEDALKRDLKFKRRQQQAKRALSEQKSVQESKNKEKEDKEKEQADQEIERKKQEKMQRQKQAEKKKEIEKILKQKKEEEEKKEKAKEEEEQRVKKMKSMAAKEFVQKQKEKLQQEFEQKQREREKAEQEEKENEAKKMANIKNKKAKMDKFYQQQVTENKELETKEQESLNKFLGLPDVQKVLTEHEKLLFPIFKLYSTQDKKQEIGQVLPDDSKITMNCNEFLKFSRQYGLSTSKELNQDDMQLVFRAINGTQITFQEFQLALLRTQLLWNSQDSELHSQRVLKSLENNTSVALEAFLYKVEGKSLKGYSKQKSPRVEFEHQQRKLKSTPAQQNQKIINTDIEESMGNIGTVKQTISQKINVDQADAEAVQKMLDSVPDFD